MRRTTLMTGAAITALAVSPAWATEQEAPLSGSLSGTVEYSNTVNASVSTEVSYTKELSLTGSVSVGGNIGVDSSAVAVIDSKQILVGNEVSFREENELNGENGYVDPVFGGGYSESGLDPNDGLIDGVWQTQIRAGFFAPIINTVEDFSVDGEGNIGVNIAAGYYNQQENIVALAVSTFESDDDGDGGWAEASTTSLQAAVGNSYAAAPGEVLDEDDPESGGGGNNFRDRNTVGVGTISGEGNIGVNVAAGAFNQQQNLLALAVASDASLAEANAAVIQAAVFNTVEAQDSINTVSGLSLSGLTGNVGVNLAAGVGNMQHNSLSAAVSSGSATPQTPTPGPTPVPAPAPAPTPDPS